MFLVFNKQKITSYLVAFTTVAVLFCGAGFFVPKFDETVETSTSGSRLLPIYSVETEEKKISLTINCAWSQIPMG